MSTSASGSDGSRAEPRMWRLLGDDSGGFDERSWPGFGSQPRRRFRHLRAAELPDDLWQPRTWSSRAIPAPPNPAWAEWTAVALIVAYNPLVNEAIPGPLYIPANLLAAAALIWLAWRSGATADLVGMRRDRVHRGLVVGVKAAALAVGAVVVLTVLPWTRSYLADDRFIGVPGTEVLYETLWLIPLGTAAGEEIMFRGVLLGDDL